MDYIKEKEKVEIENNTAQQTTNTYTTIGEIDEENNILKYGNIVDMTNKDTIGYITTITSIIEQNLIRFNSSFIGYVLSTVNNSVGVYLTTKDDNFALLGIPTSYQSNLTSIFNQIVKAIENGSDGFASKIKTTFKTQKDVQLEVTNNYISYLKSEFDKIIIDVNSFVNSIIKAQENYQRNVAKLLFVTSTYNNSEGYDGYQDKEGNISIYKLTTTTDNVRKILGSAKTNIGEVIDVINKKVDPYNLLPNIQESLIYFLFYGILKNKDNLTDFENKILIKSVSSNNLTTNSEIRTMFKEYWGSLINVEFALGIELTGEDLYKSTLIAKSKSSVDNLKGITITPSKYDFSYSIVENPDNNMKEALFNLNSKLDYDITNNKTWNQNKDNFILVKNKLSK